MKFTEKNILVFDLEVAPYDFETQYDDSTKEYLLKYADGDPEKEQEIITSLVFNPFTSRIVTIACLDFNKYFAFKNLNENASISVEMKEKYGTVFSNNETDTSQSSPKDYIDNVQYVYSDEATLIKNFWALIKKYQYNHFVTFNGREFDCPFLMLRSLILDAKPTFNLMKGSDFTFKDYHTDLMKELTFNKHSPTGARRKFSLDFYCKMLGIKSPKSGGVAGDKVHELYENKQFQTIAEYCMGDVIATAELLWKFNNIINI